MEILYCEKSAPLEIPDIRKDFMLWREIVLPFIFATARFTFAVIEGLGFSEFGELFTLLLTSMGLLKERHELSNVASNNDWMLL